MLDGHAHAHLFAAALAYAAGCKRLGHYYYAGALVTLGGVLVRMPSRVPGHELAHRGRCGANTVSLREG